MGRIVARSAAVHGDSAWAKARPARQLLNSCALGVSAAVMVAYGLSAFIFGQLHFFVGDGFSLLNGLTALAAAGGCVAVGIGWGTHLVQRHWSAAVGQRCGSVRLKAYGIWALFWLAALAIELLGDRGIGWPGLTVGIAPAAQWPLFPVPVVWPSFVRFASDGVVSRLGGLAVVCVMLGVLLVHGFSRPRPGMVLYGLAVCALGAYFLGDAAWQYAAARNLAGLGNTEMAKSLAANPAGHNAWTFVCWWGGWAAIGMGIILIASGFLISSRTLQDSWYQQ